MKVAGTDVIVGSVTPDLDISLISPSILMIRFRTTLEYYTMVCAKLDYLIATKLELQGGRVGVE